MDNTKDIRKKFGKIDQETLDRLISVREIFQVPIDELYVQWEAFAVTQDDGNTDLTASNVDRFQQYLQRLLSARKIVKKPEKRKPAAVFSLSPAPARLPATPAKKQKLQPATSSPPPLSPTKAENEVLECLNPQVDPVDSGTAQLAANFDAEKYNYRTMAMKLLESADVLDDQIDTFSLLFSDFLKSKDLSLGNPCMNSQSDIACCGRIVPDSPTYDPQASLNDKLLFLETLRLGGIGQRVPLDLSALPEYAFFPGQIVGLKGRNPTGSAFVVHEVLHLPDLGMPVSPKDELLEHPIKMVVAAGPFHTQHDLASTKLENFVSHINETVKPSLVVLLGPLLDISNALVASGEVEVPNLPANQQPKNLTELFQLVVAPTLRKISPLIQVILLPLISDAVAKHTSYPQAAFDRKSLRLPKNFKCFPNPSCFSVNEVLIGASNMDLFKDLKDVTKTTENGTVPVNRFERIANHVFDQRRFYPVFPGLLKKAPADETLVNLVDGYVAEDVAETAVGGLCLEVPYLGLTELGESLPDLMLLPSELKYFAKVIKGVTVINPGQFIRANRDPARQDGSYVIVHVDGADPEKPDNVQPVPGSPDQFYHNVYKRARVEIVRS